MMDYYIVTSEHLPPSRHEKLEKAVQSVNRRISRGEREVAVERTNGRRVQIAPCQKVNWSQLHRDLHHVDFLIEGTGSAFLLRPTTPAAEGWIAENLSQDVPRLGKAAVLEHRYLKHVITGIARDGLIVE